MPPLILQFDVDDNGSLKVEKIKKGVGGLGDELDRTKARAGAFGSGLASVRGNINSFAGVIANAKTIVAGFIAVLAVKKVTDFGGALLRAYGEAEAAEKRLSVALINRGEISREALKDLLDYSKELQRLTAYADDSIQAVEAELLQYGALGENLKSLTQLTVDFASAKRIDLGAAADLVGKAFSGETSMLSRHGIMLDDIKDKSERAAAALEKMGEIGRGQAAAELETTTGKLRQQANLWNDIAEEAGEVVSIIGGEFYPVSEEALQVVGNLLRDNKDGMIEFGTATAHAMLSAMPLISGLTQLLGGLAGAIAAVGSGWVEMFSFLNARITQLQSWRASSNASAIEKEGATRFSDPHQLGLELRWAKERIATRESIISGGKESFKGQIEKLKGMLENDKRLIEAIESTLASGLEKNSRGLTRAGVEFIRLNMDIVEQASSMADEYTKAEEAFQRLAESAPGIDAVGTWPDAIRKAFEEANTQADKLAGKFGIPGKPTPRAGIGGSDGLEQQNAWAKSLLGMEAETRVLNAETDIQRKLEEIRNAYDEKRSAALQAQRDIQRDLTIAEKQALNNYLLALEKGQTDEERLAWEQYAEEKSRYLLDAEIERLEAEERIREQQREEEIERERLQAETIAEIRNVRLQGLSESFGMSQARLGGSGFDRTFQDLQSLIEMRVNYVTQMEALNERLNASNTTQAEREQILAQQSLMTWQNTLQSRIGMMNTFGSMFMEMAGMLEQRGKKGAAIAKSMAIVGTIINTASAAMGVFANIVNMPGLGPAALPLAQSAAAVVGAFGAAKIALIASQKYHVGGRVGEGPGTGNREVNTVLLKTERVLNERDSNRIDSLARRIDSQPSGRRPYFAAAPTQYIVLSEREFNRQIQSPGTRAEIMQIAREAKR